MNLVTIDYIIQATLSPALYNEGRKTYHLTGPNPSKAREFYELFVDELYKKDQKAIFQLD